MGYKKEIEVFRTLVVNTNELLNWLLSLQSEVLEIDGPHRVDFFCRLLANMHEELCKDNNEQEKNIELKIESNFNISPQMNATETDAFNMIFNEVKQIKDDIKLFTILGSYRDMSVSRGWSDIDAFMIVKDEALINWERVKELRKKAVKINKLFKDICPLQHHGVIVIAEHEMNNYSSHLMPLTVLQSSSALFMDNPLLFKITKSFHKRTIKGMESRLRYMYEAQRTGIFMHHPYRGEGLYINDIAVRGGMYQLFCLMGYMMTVPSYFLDAIGQSCLKEDSFVQIREYIPESELIILDSFSNIRKQWGEIEGHQYKLNNVPRWILERLDENWFDKCVSLLEVTINYAKKINSWHE